jgi:uncharacterized protein YjbI with pentapeptide repeats
MEEQTKQQQTLWQQIKQHPVATVLIALLAGVIVLAALEILGYIFNWDWTGLTATDFKSQKTTNIIVYQPGKTLWDWLGLLGVLAIPVVVGFGVALFTAQQSQAEADRAAQQAKESEANREKRHQTDLEIAEKNREREQQTALQIALDSQREEILQAYIDKMAELLLTESFRVLHEEEATEIARVRTLTTLEQLDGKRKRIVLQFFYEARLIDKDKCIISLKEANLKDAELRDIILRRADLKEAYLYGADLRDADLSGTCLQSARLDNVRLDNATLSNADLSKARLPEANLARANLSGADLSYASLEGAYMKTARLEGANLQGATYNTKPIQKKSEKEQPIFDQSGKPVMIEQITQWPPDFKKIAEVICVDC